MNAEQELLPVSLDEHPENSTDYAHLVRAVVCGLGLPSTDSDAVQCVRQVFDDGGLEAFNKDFRSPVYDVQIGYDSMRLRPDRELASRVLAEHLGVTRIQWFARNGGDLLGAGFCFDSPDGWPRPTVFALGRRIRARIHAVVLACSAHRALVDHLWPNAVVVPSGPTSAARASLPASTITRSTAANLVPP